MAQTPSMDDKAKAKAQYLKAAEEIDNALAKIQKLKVGVNGLDKKMEDLDKALQ